MEFRDKVMSGRIVKFWKSANDLPGQVVLSLTHSIKMYPAVGWIRANRAASEELLNEINNLRKENESFKKMIEELQGSIKKTEIRDIASLDEKFIMHGDYSYRGYGGVNYQEWSYSATWEEIFASISPYLLEPHNEDSVKNIIGNALFSKSESRTYGKFSSLNDQDFRTIKVQFMALNLINSQYAPTVSGSMATFWTLTPKGKGLMLQIRTIKSKKSIVQYKAPPDALCSAE